MWHVVGHKRDMETMQGSTILPGKTLPVLHQGIVKAPSFSFVITATEGCDEMKTVTQHKLQKR
jgi:hypothetical protein